MSEHEWQEACVELGDHHAFLHREVHRAHEQIVALHQRIKKYEAIMRFISKTNRAGTQKNLHFAIERMEEILEGETS